MSPIRIFLAGAAAAAVSIAALAPLPAQPSRGERRGGGGSCTYFADANYRGMRGSLDDGSAIAWIGQNWNDRISSVQCDPGCALEAYEDINFGGARERFSGHVGFVGPAWNDRASALRVHCRGGDWGRDDRRGWRDHDRPASWPNGYYRRRNDPTVWSLYGRDDDRACRVADPAQMQRFGGFGQVRHVEPNADLLRGREDRGLCRG